MQRTILLAKVEVVRLLGVGRTTFYRWEFDGHGPRRTRSGKRYRYAPIDVLRWMLKPGDVDSVRTWIYTCRDPRMRALSAQLDQEHAELVAAQTATRDLRRRCRPSNGLKPQLMHDARSPQQHPSAASK